MRRMQGLGFLMELANKNRGVTRGTKKLLSVPSASLCPNMEFSPCLAYLKKKKIFLIINF